MGTNIFRVPTLGQAQGWVFFIYTYSMIKMISDLRCVVLGKKMVTRYIKLA